MTVRIASEWLNACSGCEIAIVDMGERLLDVLARIDVVHMPVLMDHKYLGQLGKEARMSIPEADVGIISGGIRNEHHLEAAKEMRRKCRIIVALGTCATHGGIPALSNSYNSDEILARYYSTETTDKDSPFPGEGLPSLLAACYALDEKIAVDVYLPGCPPHPDQIYMVLTALLNAERIEPPGTSVCDTCPTVRSGKGHLKTLKRFFQFPADTRPDEPLDRMRCLLEQGVLCMGPVTRAGCGGKNVLARCISARVPCRGCHGPVKREGNQLLDMLNALASNGIDISSLPETTSLLRFSGAHQRLRPVPPPPKKD